MKDNFEYIDELIAKVLANEATPDEKVWLQSWSEESELNKVYLEDSKKLFDQINETKGNNMVDTNAAWQKLNERIDGADTKIIELPKPKRNFQIAAAIALLISLSFLIKVFMNTDSVKPVVYAAEKRIVEQKLPDGSKVFINKNSEIAYSVKDDVREVKLKGEAYFEVVHNEEQPFVINVNDVLIKDIGTEFNVRTLDNGDIEVKVEGGEVQFYTENNEGLRLVKGEKAQYSQTARKFTKVNTDIFDNTSSYHSRIFNFKNARLQDVLDQINQVYNSDIRLGNAKLANCRVNSPFNNQSIEEIVGVIAEIFDLKVEKKDTTFILSGEDCPIL